VQPALQLHAPHGAQVGESLAGRTAKERQVGPGSWGGPCSMLAQQLPSCVVQCFRNRSLSETCNTTSNDTKHMWWVQKCQVKLGLTEPFPPAHVQCQDGVSGQLKQRPFGKALRSKQLHSPHGPNRIQRQEGGHI
jgi:hypothetical protein